jgi:hypothetical protein
VNDYKALPKIVRKRVSFFLRLTPNVLGASFFWTIEHDDS